MPYCSSFLYKLLRGVPMTSAVFEIFQAFSRSLSTRNALSADSLNSRRVPGRSLSPSGVPSDVDQLLDGVVLNLNDLVLVKNQATASRNAVYRVVAVDAATSRVTLEPVPGIQ